MMGQHLHQRVFQLATEAGCSNDWWPCSRMHHSKTLDSFLKSPDDFSFLPPILHSNDLARATVCYWRCSRLRWIQWWCLCWMNLRRTLCICIILSWLPENGFLVQEVTCALSECSASAFRLTSAKSIVLVLLEKLAFGAGSPCWRLREHDAPSPLQWRIFHWAWLASLEKRSPQAFLLRRERTPPEPRS